MSCCRLEPAFLHQGFLTLPGLCAVSQVQGGHSKDLQEVKGLQFHRGEQQNVSSEVRFGVSRCWGDHSAALDTSGGGLWWMLEQLQPCPAKPSGPAPPGAQGCVPQLEFMEG